MPLRKVSRLWGSPPLPYDKVNKSHIAGQAPAGRYCQLQTYQDYKAYLLEGIGGKFSNKQQII